MNSDHSTTKGAYEHLDAALRALSEYGPTLPGGLFNHAPMVAEALCTMGYGEHALKWVEDNRHDFTRRPPIKEPLTDETWKQGLGDSDRFPDWAAYFRHAFATYGWQRTLDLWCTRLVPGFSTAACHGVIRTAHAARALTHEETEARLHELADGLGAWASLYGELPVAALEPRQELTPADALRALEPLPDHERPAAGLIAEGLEALRESSRFADQVARVDLAGDTTRRLDELVAAFADLFVASARSPYTAIVFTHAVTAAAAARNLCPVIGEQTGRVLAFRAWEAGCALQAVFGAPSRCGSPSSAAPRRAPDDLIRAAVEHGDDHVIKLTEACVTTYHRYPAEALLTAAQHGQALLPSASTPHDRGDR